MLLSLRVFLVFLVVLCGAGAQNRPNLETAPHDDDRLPNGKSRSEEILKADHEKTLDDARQLVAVSQSLQKDLEESGAFVLSLSELKKTEEIERLAKRIRSRIKR
jgi:hypothetical protein